jgi:hypothetical protein
MAWRHVVISTHSSWLPGDPRGFRSWGHKIHSSGDYRNPPPASEHAGLFRYSKRISGNAVIIPHELRESIGRAILAELRKRGTRVLALAVAGMHTQIQVELPDDMVQIRQFIGKCKTAACFAVRMQMPGKIWGRYGTYKRIANAEHQRSVYGYILRQADAWIWSFSGEAPPPETPPRKPRRLSAAGVMRRNDNDPVPYAESS